MHLQPLVQTRTLAKLAMGAVAISSLAEVAESVVYARLIADLNSMNIFKVFTLGQQMEQVKTMQQVSIVAAILAGIMFIVWFYFAYRNLARIGKGLNHDAGWAIGAWFVPILNLFRPYAIYGEMADTYALVAHKFPQHARGAIPRARMLSILGGCWWGLFLVSRLFEGIAYTAERNAKGFPVSWWTWPNYLVALSGVAAILVIYQLSKVEGVVYRAWISGDYQAYVEAKELAKAEATLTPEDGKSANWYKTETENEKSLRRDDDPFR